MQMLPMGASPAWNDDHGQVIVVPGGRGASASGYRVRSFLRSCSGKMAGMPLRRWTSRARYAVSLTAVLLAAGALAPAACAASGGDGRHQWVGVGSFQWTRCSIREVPGISLKCANPQAQAREQSAAAPRDNDVRLSARR